MVAPVAHRLAHSVANPLVLSVLLWDRLKRMTPQRARDLTRLLSTALGNALGVLGAERAKQLAGTAHKLQDQFVDASVSQPGREVVLNSVATAAKVAQAFATPESKQATRQLFATVQSVVDFFASAEGRGIFATLGECLAQLGDVAASPEASIFLAELATNLLHALEAERVRREQTEAEAKQKKQEAEVKEEVEVKEELREDQDGEEKPLSSPASSTAETRWSFDTEAAMSDAAFSMRYRDSITPSITPVTHMYAASSASTTPQTPMYADSSSTQLPPAEKPAARSARIEKEVLIRMGVDPSMLSEIQRVLDRLADEEAERARRAAMGDEEEDVAGMAVPETTDSGEDDDANITFAFGLRSSSMPSIGVEEEEKAEERADAERNEVMLPEWNTSAVHDALRRRHVQTTEAIEHRDTSEMQTREMAAVLAQRQSPNAQHSDLSPSDLAACRVIAQVLILGFSVFVVVAAYLLARGLFG